MVDRTKQILLRWPCARRVMVVVIAAVVSLELQQCWSFLALVLSCFELALYFLLSWRSPEHVSTESLLSSEPESFDKDHRHKFTLIEKLLPHPYLGYVNHNNPPAGVAPRSVGKRRANKQGFVGPDFPTVHSSEAFTMAITGGSVAEHFAGRMIGDVPPLELVLNRDYIPPAGKSKFSVFNGAVAGWKQPQQLIFSVLYAQRFDAILTLDGYNELQFLVLGGRQRDLSMEYPWVRVLDPRLRSPHLYQPLFRAIRLLHRSASLPLLKHSYVLYYLNRRTRRGLRCLAHRPVSSVPTTLESIFGRELEAQQEGIFECELERLVTYVRLMNHICGFYGTRCAHFVQPCAVFKNHLTASEQDACVRSGYEDDYRVMEERLLGLVDEGILVSSLLDIFRDARERIYKDDAHFVRDDLGISKAEILIAERMAAYLSTIWALERR